MADISKLVHKGKVVGYRFTSNLKRYDVELETVNRMGIVIDGVEKSIVLKEAGNLLMSKTEFEKGRLAEDVSGDTKKLNELLSLLNSNDDLAISSSDKPDGYNWEGMVKITKQEALDRFNVNKEVFLLYPDGTEGAVENIESITGGEFNDYEFGYERKNV